MQALKMRKINYFHSFIHYFVQKILWNPQTLIFFGQGDSGGPIFELRESANRTWEAILIGVTLGSDDFCSTYEISSQIAARVGYFRKWIEDKTRL